ncbi:MAG: HlyD family efflux transporter periplasmic adaptor subunit [Myxococcales bacterium]|nr:HlyD family efflux transporter periplasmic adaptor subunit [Myxococcales bacterium]
MANRKAKALLVVALVASACGAEKAKEAQLTFTVKKGDLVFGRSFYGELEARKSIAIHTPELPGIYQLTVEWLAEDGTKVKKGDKVLTFETGIIEGELTDLQAQLSVARAAHTKLVAELENERIEASLAVRRAVLGVERARLDVVAGVGLISKVELEKAKIGLSQAKLALTLARKAVVTLGKKRKAALEVQRLNVAAIDEKVKEKQQQIAAAVLRSPADGVLYAPYTRLNWVRGKAAAGSVTRPGDRILEIPDLSAFNVALYVRQRDASLLSVGDKAVVVPTVLPDRPIEATVISKDSFAATRNERLGTRESQGNLKEVKILLKLSKNFPQLRPGGTVRADVKSNVAQGVTVVPLVALEEVPGGYRARVVGKKDPIKVKIGRITATHGEVLSGLSVGDKVILPKQSAASAGAAGKGKGKKGAAGKAGPGGKMGHGKKGRRGRSGGSKAGRRKRGGGGGGGGGGH